MVDNSLVSIYGKNTDTISNIVCWFENNGTIISINKQLTNFGAISFSGDRSNQIPELILLDQVYCKISTCHMQGPEQKLSF